MSENYRNQEEDLACAGNIGTVTIREVEYRTLKANISNAIAANVKFSGEIFKQKHRILDLEGKIVKAAKLIGSQKQQIAELRRLAIALQSVNSKEKAKE